MAVMQSIFCDHEFAFGFKDDEIRIVASGNTAFARVASRKSSRLCCHPARQIRQRESALGLASVHIRAAPRKGSQFRPTQFGNCLPADASWLADRESGR